jgi:hypothetical protein
MQGTLPHHWRRGRGISRAKGTAASHPETISPPGYGATAASFRPERSFTGNRGQQNLKACEAPCQIGIEPDIPPKLGEGIVRRLECHHPSAGPYAPGHRQGVSAEVRADVECDRTFVKVAGDGLAPTSPLRLPSPIRPRFLLGSRESACRRSDPPPDPRRPEVNSGRTGDVHHRSPRAGQPRRRARLASVPASDRTVFAAADAPCSHAPASSPRAGQRRAVDRIHGPPHAVARRIGAV